MRITWYEPIGCDIDVNAGVEAGDHTIKHPLLQAHT